MRRPLLTITVVCLALIVVGVGGIRFAINRAIPSHSGPVHHFRVGGCQTFLTDDDAARLAREVMNLDGYPEPAWRLMEDDRSKTPDGRPDRFFLRNTANPNRGVVSFSCEQSPTPARYVNIEMRDGEVTAQGTLAK